MKRMDNGVRGVRELHPLTSYVIRLPVFLLERELLVTRVAIVQNIEVKG